MRVIMRFNSSKLLAAASFLLLAATTVPARAQQADIAGEWGARIHEDQPHRGPGAELGDYTGLPINAAVRQKASHWDASILSLPEQMSKPHPAQYFMRGPGPNMRINKIMDPVTQVVIAYTLEGVFGRDDRVIWMDGRPHPPEYAPYSWSGFSTGEWIGNTLKVETTHIKASYLRRNGAAFSEKAKMTEFIDRHGDILTITMILTDPVYLEEPFIQTTNYVANDHTQLTFYPCTVSEENISTAFPHFLPGTTEHMKDANGWAPTEGVRGGAESLYPDFRAKLPKK